MLNKLIIPVGRGVNLCGIPKVKYFAMATLRSFFIMNNTVQVAVIHQEHTSYFHPVHERRVKLQEACLSHSSSVNNFTLEQTV